MSRLRDYSHPDWQGEEEMPPEEREARDRMMGLAEPPANGKPCREPPPLPPPPERFPTSALPESLERFVVEGSAAIGCDPSYIALPALAAIAGAIGNTYRIGLKRDWSEPAVLWAVVVGESGTLKSPALDLATAPLRVLQSQAITRWQHSMDVYEDEALEYKRSLTTWNRGNRGEPPAKPRPPICPRYIVSDITVEALADRLADNPRGVLLLRDELSAWLRGFDRYKSRGGADVGAWLEMHRAGMLLIDRKSGGSITHVRHAAVSVTGGIQPAILKAALAGEHFEDGLAARLLLTMPTPTPKRWTEAEVGEETSESYAAILHRLLELQPGIGDDDTPRPKSLGMTAEAKAAWISFHDEHAAEQAELTGDLAAAWSKIEGYAARLALVLHLAGWAAGETIDTQAVDERSMLGGITLARWFAGEARRVYAVLEESAEARDRRRLIELIRRKGGTITPRQLSQSDRRFRGDTQAAEAALLSLAAAGFGTMEEAAPGRSGGRPSRIFRLSTCLLSTKP